jgi:hypothetical protein
MALSDSTLLAITGITIPDYAIRGLTLNLQLINASDGLQRSINGSLLDLTAPQFRKYKATLTCEDQDVPTLTDIWQGQIVTITCIPGVGPANNTDGTLTMNMMVDAWTTSRAEWDALTSWSIDFLEI